MTDYLLEWSYCEHERVVKESMLLNFKHEAEKLLKTFKALAKDKSHLKVKITERREIASV